MSAYSSGLYCCLLLPSSHTRMFFCLRCFPLVSRCTKETALGLPFCTAYCLPLLFFPLLPRLTVRVHHTHPNNHHLFALLASSRKAHLYGLSPQARHIAAIAATSHSSNICTICPFISAARSRYCSSCQQSYRDCFTRLHLCQMFTSLLQESCLLFANQIRVSFSTILLRCRTVCHN